MPAVSVAERFANEVVNYGHTAPARGVWISDGVGSTCGQFVDFYLSQDPNAIVPPAAPIYQATQTYWGGSYETTNGSIKGVNVATYTIKFYTGSISRT